MKNWRVNLIFFLIFLFAAAITSRLVFIQIRDREYWKAMAQGQHRYFASAVAIRGEIFLKDVTGNSYRLATGRDWPYVCVSAEKIFNRGEEAESIIKKISEILELDETVLLPKIEDSFNVCEVIKTRITPEQDEALNAAALPGVYIKTEKLRYYPQEIFLSDVLGFVGGEGTGQYGLEGYYEKSLQGVAGFVEGERGLFTKTSAEKGKDLDLTIDYNIQFTAENLLAKAKTNLNIEGGTIIVGDPFSGELFALANYPTYNPNEYAKEENLEVFKNDAIQKVYEPGSTIKPITMAAGLEEGVITPETSYVDEGFVKIAGHTLTNYNQRVYGKATMTEVLEKSINTGAVFAERQVGQEKFLEYLERFGFFEPTGIDLQGEVFSENKNLKAGREINYATAAFGQGIEITPMQMFRAFCAIANGGKLVQPHLVENPPEEVVVDERRAISSETANQLTTMLVNVTEKGFGKAARIPGYYIAGKTGTAQVAFTSLGIDKEGYSEKTNQIFIGFAPAYDPRFLILIKLDNPEARTAEYSALPIFRELAKYVIDYLQIPPDYE
ncbi:MAG: penicillin-binding protein 2 [bacterium]